MTTERDIGLASRTGPSASATAAVCALLVAAVLTGTALTAPGSGLGVRTEGPATTAEGAATGGPARSIAPATRSSGAPNGSTGRWAVCATVHAPSSQGWSTCR
ncbi:hypothetical protein [Streptomyces sp. NPDC059455]|uniref:hypothetical protein n=1 Tax=Streptomyces sp. NPDC059455 TaxID=3346837 RepID=UPI0036C9492A